MSGECIPSNRRSFGGTLRRQTTVLVTLEMKTYAACLILASLLPTAQGAAVAVDWNAPLNSGTPATTTVNIGDVVTFTWTGTHDVMEFASQSKFASCDFTGATRRRRLHSNGDHNASPYEYPVPDGQPIRYFGCSIAGHCAGGQKLTMTVTGGTTSAPVTSAPVAASSASSTARMTVAIVGAAAVVAALM